MKLTFPTNKEVTLETAFSIETATADYLEALLITTTDTQELLLLSDVYPIKFYIDVADRIVIGSMATVTAAVTLLYESSESVEPLEMATVLSTALKQSNDASTRSFAFSSDSSQVAFIFDAMQNGSAVLDVRNTSGYSATEVGLIVVTSFLSLMLVIVSSVLLHITGGWKVCANKLSNCLFEEVDDDEELNVVTRKGTYPIQGSEDDDDDEESNMTSIPPSSASGILGVASNRDNPAAGLGILSPNGSDDDSSMMYGDGVTPESLHNNPMSLGITSMRKLPNFSPEAVRGGFSGMVMQRLTHNDSKVK